MPKNFVELNEGIPGHMHGKLMPKGLQDLGLTGVCCAFAMDWAGRRLAGSVINTSIYSQASVLDSIVENQAKQLNGGITGVAEGTWLNMQSTSCCTFEEDDADNWSITAGALGRNICYVSVDMGWGRGHGFAIDNRQDSDIQLSDAYSGVYKINNITASEAVKEHLKLLKAVDAEAYVLSYTVTTRPRS